MYRRETARKRDGKSSRPFYPREGTLRVFIHTFLLQNITIIVKSWEKRQLSMRRGWLISYGRSTFFNSTKLLNEGLYTYHLIGKDTYCLIKISGMKKLHIN